MTDDNIYNDLRGPLDLSTAAREQELFYCELTQQQIEQIRTAFDGDLQRAANLYHELTDKLIAAVAEEDFEKPLDLVTVEDLIASDKSR
tara:strand:- start:173 stop:439 length:267 start_codon:yes stop_codon:yes gene_type:complete